MTGFEKFNFNSFSELENRIEELDLSIDYSRKTDILREGVSKNSLYFPNALAIHPMEGFDAKKNGSPSKLTERRYLRYAAGGAGLIWWEATSMVEEGKSNPEQLMINKNTIGNFSNLINKMNEKAKEEMGSDFIHYNILQLNHSGRYSKPEGKQAPIFLFHDPYLDELVGVKENDEHVSDAYLEKIRDEYIKAAVLANKAGFDGVDIKACHRYLLSELLAGYTRGGKFGRHYKKRVKLIKEIVQGIKSKLGDDLILAIRLNVYDSIPYPYGWGVDKDFSEMPDLTEPIRFVEELYDMGVKIFSISAGDPRFKTHIVRPYDRPVKGKDNPPEHPLKSAERLFELTASIQEIDSEIITVGSGYSWFRQYFPQIAAGNILSNRVTLAGVGRMAFAYPEFAKDIIRENGLKKNKVCITCSKCTELMMSGGPNGCVIRDGDIYAKFI